MRLTGSLLPVHTGEGRQAAQLAAAMFLTFAGLGVGVPAVESLFLTRVGARYLPSLYLALGAVTTGISVLIGTIFGRIERRSLYQGIPIALAVWLVAARILMGLDLRWSYGPIYLSLFVAFSLQMLFTWGAASMVFDTRQAKRLFPLFAAGGILGRALGGLSAGLWVRLVGTENLLLLWAGALLLAFGCVRLVLAQARRPPRRSSRVRREAAHSFGAGLVYVARSRMLRRLAAAAMLFAGLFFLLIYPFSRQVALSFPETDRLARFLGLFQGLTTAVAFLASALLANRFYARFGLMAGIGVFALIYLAGFSTLAVAGRFPLLAVFRFLELSWMYGFASTALQAVYNILPAERREQSRLSVDGVFRPIGISGAGAVLLLAGDSLSLSQLSLIGAVLAAAATAMVLLARASYTGALAEALRAGRPEVFFPEDQPFGELRRDPAAVAGLLSALRGGEPHSRRIAAQILGSLREPRAASALTRALNDPDAGVRGAAVAALAPVGRAGAARSLPEIASLLADPVAEVRRQAAITLGRWAVEAPHLRAQLRPLLDDEEPSVQAEAASALIRLGREPQAFALLERMSAAERGEHRVLALRALGACGGQRVYRLACANLGDPRAAVRQAALRAVSRIDALRSLKALAAALGDDDPSVAGEAAAHLGEIAAADPSIPSAAQARQLLFDSLEEPAREAGALQGLERLPARTVLAAIRAYAPRKLEQARRYARQGQALGDLHDRTLLASALQDGRRRQATLALQAVGLLKGPETVRLALQHLGGGEPQLRANALEMIDSLGEREITREVVSALEGQSDRYRPGRGEPADAAGLPNALTAVLAELLRDPDPWVRACAAFAVGSIERQRRDGLESELQRLAEDPDPLVRDTALRAVNGGTAKMENVERLSMMERVLWLQGVPLFAELPPAELKQVAKVCFEARFADGELIGAEEEIGEEMFVIVSGEVQIVAGEAAGGERELARRGMGEPIGEMSILSGAPRMAAMVASGEVHVLGIARREFEQILRQRPETSLAVMRVLCARLRESQGRQRAHASAS